MEFVLLADRPDAIPTVAGWYVREWHRVMPGHNYERTCERLRGKLNRDRLPMHVLAVEGGEVIGVVQLKVREMSIYPEREHWLGTLFVRPESRGKGVGSALCRAAKERAAALGVEMLHLQTEDLSGGLYARLGWRGVEQVWYNGVRVLVMECRLSGAAAAGGGGG
jgi:predicted N-acetyltransferase YhbS